MRGTIKIGRMCEVLFGKKHKHGETRKQGDDRRRRIRQYKREQSKALFIKESENGKGNGISNT